MNVDELQTARSLGLRPSAVGADLTDAYYSADWADSEEFVLVREDKE